MIEKDKTKKQLAQEVVKPLREIAGLRKSEAERTKVVNRFRLSSALAESESHYRELADSISDVFFEMDKDFKYTHWNKASEDLTGIPAREALGKSLYEIFPDIRGTKAEKAYLSVLRNKRPVTFVNKYRLKGIDYFFEISAYPSRRGLSVFVKDITEKKKVEEALQESEEKYRNLVERANDGIGITQDKLMKYMNPHGAEILGYKVQEIIGTPFTNYIHPDEVRRVVSYYTQRMEGKKVPSTYETTLIDRQGRKILVELNASVVSYQGKAADMVIFRDITERKQAEEALKESEERYRDLVEKAESAILIDDEKGNFKFFNKKYAELFGYSFEEMKKQSIKSVVHPDDVERVMRIHRRRVQGKKAPSKYEFKGIKKDGSTIYVEVDAVELRDKDRIVGTRSYIWDITERKRAEEELKASKEEMRMLADHLRTVREQERMLIAREIHDELGQSLTALKMDLFWLKNRMPADQKSLFEKTEQMTQLIDKTIQRVKIISSELRPRLLDDLGLLAAIEWQGEEFESHTGIKCEMTKDAQDMELDQDFSMAVFRIFQEALTNVARHADATKVKVSLREKAGRLELKVRDNGKGIPERKISDPKSFGIVGMKERVYFLGGKIEIKGVQDKGTIIKMIIPLPKRGVTKR